MSFFQRFLARKTRSGRPANRGDVAVFDQPPVPGDLLIRRPTELADHFSYILLSAPDEYPKEDGESNASAFGHAFKALAFFRSHTRTSEGREAVDQVLRSLHVVFELFEKGSSVEARRLLQEQTEPMFRSARAYIALSDE